VHGPAAYPWLGPGDLVELTVAGLGTLTNPVVAGAPGTASV
jgi:2-keto-4-pentenoate hydratase/2-oxohepta-3-ene-1,7-dioic acid hydratase in catechol pathway